MPRARRLSVSHSNMIWFAIVLAAMVIGGAVGGWSTALIAGAAGLVVSEIAERTARARRVRA